MSSQPFYDQGICSPNIRIGAFTWSLTLTLKRYDQTLLQQYKASSDRSAPANYTCIPLVQCAMHRLDSIWTAILINTVHFSGFLLRIRPEPQWLPCFCVCGNLWRRWCKTLTDVACGSCFLSASTVACLKRYSYDRPIKHASWPQLRWNANSAIAAMHADSMLIQCWFNVSLADSTWLAATCTCKECVGALSLWQNVFRDGAWGVPGAGGSAAEAP